MADTTEPPAAPPPASHARPERLGDYTLEQRLASGGMAEVYLASREGAHGFRKRVALKRILPHMASDPEFVAMFIDEARVTASLSHPNVVQVFDFGEDRGELFMAMELVVGTTAAQLIRGAIAAQLRIPLGVVLHVMISVLRGLAHAHDARDEYGRPLRLVHRDVSPSNVLIAASGAVKITDFGIARAADIERRTDVGQIKGKLGYMSPEQVLGRELDGRSDVFSAAIVLAELVLLRSLFAGGSEMEVLTRIRDSDLRALDEGAYPIDPKMRELLERALSKRPADRYPSAGAFADALEAHARGHRLRVGASETADLIAALGLISDAAPLSEDDRATARPFDPDTTVDATRPDHAGGRSRSSDRAE